MLSIVGIFAAELATGKDAIQQLSFKSAAKAAAAVSAPVVEVAAQVVDAAPQVAEDVAQLAQ